MQTIDIENVSNTDWDNSNTNENAADTPESLGISVTRSDFQTPILQFSCEPTERGTYVFPDHRSVTDSQLNISQRLQLVDYSDSINELLGKPGIHVWMVFDDDSFAAARTFSVYETLSKHGDIYRRGGFKAVRAAGECDVHSGRRVYYNFQSGSFMRQIAERFAVEHPTLDYSPLFERWMTRKWLSGGASWVRFTESPFIHASYASGNLSHVRNKVLANYEHAGIPVYEFDSKQDCMKYAKTVSPIERAKQSMWRKQYDALKEKGYIRQATTFEDWLDKQGFTIPVYEKDLRRFLVRKN